MTKNRLETFSDGVFTVAITLLVLNFKMPKGPVSALKDQLFALWPNMLAFIISFVIVGVFWVAHHHVFQFIVKTNRTHLWINNLFLMTIAFMPFPAGVLGKYPFSRVSIILYGCTLIATDTLLTLSWMYATRASLLNPRTPADFRGLYSLIIFAPVFAYAAAIAISYVNLLIPLLIFAVVPLFYIVPHGFIERRVAKVLEEIEQKREKH